MATEKNIPNLTINKVENQDVFDYLVTEGLVNENELYLIPGEAEGGVTDVLAYNSQGEYDSVVDFDDNKAYLGAAARKNVDDDITSITNAWNLPTSEAVIRYVQRHLDISNTTITLLSRTKTLATHTPPVEYERWVCKTDGGSSGISDKPTGSTNAGFVCEVYMNRFASITDYRYKLICWVQGDNYPYIATVEYNTSSISWTHWADTKNTTGSTDTSSKIYLVGATSQAANPQTYSDNEVYATSGVLTTKSVQVGGTVATMQYNSTDKCIEFVFA